MADLASDVAADRTADLSATDKIGEAMRRSLPRLPAEAQAVVLKLLEPENLAIIGVTVGAWGVSQFVGIGEIVDFILLVLGIWALGSSAITGARELYDFVTTAVNAQTSQDLDAAAQHFEQAVTILTIAVVQAVLLKGAAGKVAARSRPQVKPRIEVDDPPNATDTAGLVFDTTEPVAVSGSRAIDLGQSYEQGVRGLYGNASFQERVYSTLVDGEEVDGVADDVTSVAGKDTAVEAKYVDDWDNSLRNPDSPNGTKPWAVDEQQAMVDQAQKYSNAFEGGVIYHTNSLDLASYYTSLFNNARITNFKFIITPAVKQMR
jgi:hypothetical protein